MAGFVAHLDAECFYVSAERVRHPDLLGKPVGVLGNNGACVIVKSYEMKARGVKAGTPIWDAVTLCPEGVYIKRGFSWYEVLSRKMPGNPRTCRRPQRAREACQPLLSQGWRDALRHLNPGQPILTCWDGSSGSWRRNAGLRIGLHLLNSVAARRLRRLASIGTSTGGRKRNHAPTWAERCDRPVEPECIKR